MSTRSVMITDLDEPEHGQPVHSTHNAQRLQHKRQRKPLQTVSGNFSRRSRSVEYQGELRRPEVANTAMGTVAKKKSERTLNVLLQSKEQQLEQLLQRLATLHSYNEQFAAENEKLRANTDQLEHRLTQTQQQLSNCPRCQQLAQKLSVLLGQNKTLLSDVDMLKTLVFRLNVQIECYQDQQRDEQHVQTTPAAAASAAHMPSNLPQWTNVPTHTLTPLLQAYDESLRDKDALIAQYGADFEHFTAELKRALEENTRLLQSQESLKRDVGSWREERTCLQAQLSVCRDKAEAQTRKTDLAKEKLVEVMHCYEQRNQTLMLDMDHLQSAYARTKSELAALKSAAAAGTPDAETVQHCKSLLEQLKLEHAREQQQLQLRNEELQRQRTELQSKCEQLRQELSTQQTQLDKHSSQVEELQRKASSLLRSTEKAKHSRDRLKARLRIALQWAQKLEAGNAEMRDTYDAVRRLEVLVKHKESQLRGLHARNLEELEKMRQKLEQKDETIKTLLRNKIERRAAVD